jgi:hypothetical protein
MMTSANAVFATRMKIRVTCQPAMETYTELMKGMDIVHCTRGNAGSPTAQMLHMKMAIAIATKAFAKN